MSAVLIALIVAVASLAGPLLLSWLNARQRRAEKSEDYARQDAVAAKAEEAAALLVEANRDVARMAAETNGKLDVIHTLVNSNMTAAMQAELDATVRELAMMKEVIALNQAAGREPSAEATAAVLATQDKIDELSATLSDRLKQTAVAEQQQQQQQQQQEP